MTTLAGLAGTVLLALCATAHPPSPAAKHPVRLTSAGACTGLARPDSVIVRRQIDTVALPGFSGEENVTPFTRHILGAAQSVELIRSACAAPATSCTTVTDLPVSLLNGYTAVFYAGPRAVATVAGNLGIPCESLYLAKGNRAADTWVGTALHSEADWVDESARPPAFFNELAKALDLPFSDLPSYPRCDCAVGH